MPVKHNHVTIVLVRICSSNYSCKQLHRTASIAIHYYSFDMTFIRMEDPNVSLVAVFLFLLTL